MATNATMTGFLDKASSDYVLGWLSSGPKDTQAHRVTLSIDGHDVAEMTANLPRPAVAKKGHHATGNCGFRFDCGLIPENLKVGRRRVQVFATLRGDAKRIELQNSPAYVQWPNQPAPLLKLYLLDPDRTSENTIESAFRSAYRSDRIICKVEAHLKNLPSSLAPHYDFIGGALDTLSAKRLSLAPFVRAAFFYEPELHLIRHLLWLKAQGESLQAGIAVQGSAGFLSLARRAAETDYEHTAEVAKLLDWDNATVRQQFDNRQLRYFLPRATERVDESSLNRATKHLGWFDLIGVEVQATAFTEQLGQLTGNLSAYVPPLQPALDHVIDPDLLEPFIRHDRQLYTLAEKTFSAGSDSPKEAPKRTLLAATSARSFNRPGAHNGDITRRPCITINPAVSEDEKTLVVLGVSRGGTSLVAGLLRLAGVFMGHKVAHDSHEDAEFHTHDVAKLSQLIETRNQEQAIWGWKYPHSVEYLDEVIGQLRNPHFLVVFRDLVGVAQGFHRKHDIPIRDAIVEAQHRYAKVVGFVSKCEHPLLSISYEKAVAQKEDLITDLSEFCGLELSDTQKRACYDFVSPGNYVSLSAKKLSLGRL